MPDPLSAGLITQLVFVFSVDRAFLSSCVRLSLWWVGLKWINAFWRSLIKPCSSGGNVFKGGVHVLVFVRRILVNSSF